MNETFKEAYRGVAGEAQAYGDVEQAIAAARRRRRHRAGAAAVVTVVAIAGILGSTLATLSDGAGDSDRASRRVSPDATATELESACPDGDRAKGLCPLGERGETEWRRFKEAFPADLEPFRLAGGPVTNDETHPFPGEYYSYVFHLGDRNAEGVRVDVFVNTPQSPTATQARVSCPGPPEEQVPPGTCRADNGIQLKVFRSDGTRIDMYLYGSGVSDGLMDKFEMAAEKLSHYTDL